MSRVQHFPGDVRITATPLLFADRTYPAVPGSQTARESTPFLVQALVSVDVVLPSAVVAGIKTVGPRSFAM